MRRWASPRWSLLVGVHQCILHPVFVALGWRRYYGVFPRDWRVYLAILVHDWGYWVVADMQGVSGDCHPELGAAIVARVVGWCGPREECAHRAATWRWFTACHSRTYARVSGQPTSPLMEPDKLATACMPLWLYAVLLWCSDEWREHVAYARSRGHADCPEGALAFARWMQAQWRAEFAGAREGAR